MNEKKYAIAEYVTASDIKRVRRKLKMPQWVFAELVGVSKPTIERWEASEDKINGPIVLLLQMIENNLDYISKIEIPQKEYSTRLWYMFEQIICTMIDVDDVNQKVKIKNFTDNPNFKAFGVNENPTYADYLEFLESRCFPKERDKMKLILKELDLPFYDPFLIIEKTEGRMAEDYFWLRVEKNEDD